MTRAIAAVLLIVAWVATWRPALDPDLWWHLVLGAAIRRDAAIPATEALSWWTAGDPIVAHSWLWEVVLSLAHDAGGLLGVSVVGMAVTGGIVALLFALTTVTAGARLGPVGAAVVTLGAVVVAVPLWSPRAGLIDLAAVCALTLIWSASLRGGSAWALGAVPVVTLLWANLHGSGVLGYLACLLALAAAVPIGIRWGVWPRPRIGPIAITAVVGVATIAIDPAGPALFGYPFDPRVASALHAAIDEWRSPDFGALGLVGLRVVLAGAALVAIALRGRHRDPLLLLLAAGWTFLALGSVRFALIAGPLLIVTLAPGVPTAIQAWTGWRRPPRHADARLAGSGRAAPRAAVIGLAGLASLVVLVVGTRLVAPDVQDRLIAARFPVAAVDAVRVRCGGRVLNAYDWGGYLGFAWGPGIVGAYGNSPGFVVGEQRRLEDLRGDPGPFLDAHDVDLAVLKPDSALATWMRSEDGWQVALEDDVAVVFERMGAGACQRL
ncbi:MAG TPA: hypothetical protein VF119_04505 [Candidatus Limnocylindrales bacterium]